MNLSYTVNNEHYTNVKEVLKKHFKISDRLLLKLKKNNKILLNSNSISVNQSIQKGDLIEISFDYEEENSNIVPTKMPLDIIYEDDWYIVINKKPNIPIHPSLLHYEDSLSNGIRFYFDSIGLKKKIRPVTRLDKDTSGLVIFAKNEYIQECLIRQMKTSTFMKEYTAICDGILKQKSGTINAPISRKPNSIIERQIDNYGVKAITHYNLINTFSNYSVVNCTLETGRTHQIRVHMSHIGHPLLGDTLYGNSSPLITRQALHCSKLSFIHPVTNKDVNYIAPLQEDMKKLIDAKEDR